MRLQDKANNFHYRPNGNKIAALLMSTVQEAQITPVMTDFMIKLTEKVIERFKGFSIPSELLNFAWDPFSIKLETFV